MKRRESFIHRRGGKRSNEDDNSLPTTHSVFNQMASNICLRSFVELCLHSALILWHSSMENLQIFFLIIVNFSFPYSWPSLQSLLGARLGAERKKKTATDTNNLHFSTTQRARAGVPGDSLPRHLHARGDRHENRFDGGASSGKDFHSIKNDKFPATTRKNGTNPIIIFNCSSRRSKFPWKYCRARFTRFPNSLFYWSWQHFAI